MTQNEELLRLRREARKLRQENAFANRSREAHEQRADRLEQIARTQEHTIEALAKENEQLKGEIASLKSRLGVEIDKAKKYAGMIFKSNVRTKEEGKGNSRGGKKGHTGMGRKKPPSVDRTIDVYLTNCPTCITPLNRTLSVDERVVEDIPRSLPVVTLYRIERQWCAHCKKEVRGIPKGTIPGLRFGIGTVVLVLNLKYRLRTPLSKIAEILRTQYSLSITDSGIQELLHNLKTKFTKQYNDILEEVRKAPVKHADETGFRINGMNGWCWLFATPSAALYTIEDTRGKEVPNTILGRDPTGILVRDDCPSYASLPMAQQSCWAHLLRVSHEATEKENASEEMRTLHAELKNLFAELSTVLREPFDAARRKEAHRDYAKRVTLIIARQYRHDDANAVQVRIKNQNANLITALLHEHVPLTNNHAERMIRPMVVTRKISGGSRSDAGAATHATNMTVMQTLVLKGKDLFEGITEILHDGNKRYALGNGG